MRPQRQRDSSKRAALSRARMYLKARLGWLDGFPTGRCDHGVLWHRRPQVSQQPSSEIVIDRKVLRDAREGLRMLPARFPRVLRQLVGDVDEWQHRGHATLEAIGNAVHNGEDISSSSAISSYSSTETKQLRTLRRQWPGLNPVIDAIIWSCSVNRGSYQALLEWVFRNASWLSGLRERINEEQFRTSTLLLADLAHVDGSRVTEFFRHIFKHPLSLHVRTDGLKSFAHHAANHFSEWKDRSGTIDPPQRPEGSLGEVVVDLLPWLCSQKEKTRRSFVQLAPLFISTDWIEDWNCTWEKLRDIIRNGRRNVQAARSHETTFRLCKKQYYHEIQNFAKHTVERGLPEVGADDVIRALKNWCHDEKKRELTPDLIRVLSRIPGDQTNYRRDILKQCTYNEPLHTRQLRRFLPVAADLLTKYTPETVAPFLTQPTNQSPLVKLNHALLGQSRWETYFEFVGRLCANGEYQAGTDDVIATIVSHTDDLAKAQKIYVQLKGTDSSGRYLSEETFRTAIRLSAPELSVVDAYEILYDSEISLKRLNAVHKAFIGAGWPRDVLDGELRDGITRNLQKLTTLLNAMSPALSVPTVPDDPHLPDWAKRYPVRFHDTIAALAAVRDDAEHRVHSILDGFIPDPEIVYRQISEIERRHGETPENPHLRIRLENLHRQLLDPPSLSPARSDRLLRKLKNAVGRRLVALCIEATVQQLDSHQRFLAECLVQEQLPSREHTLCAGIATLGDVYRNVAWRIFLTARGKDDYDPRKEPRNQSLLCKLKAMRIDTGPWLEKPRPWTVEDSGTGHPVTLSIQECDVDVLLMGYYFGTCLSPQEFNFFSAVSNAVDINKHVIFARDHEGSVIGRCLIAIGDGGAIVPFRPYCRDSKFPFESHVSEYCSMIAGRMQTVVAHTDEVSAVVLPDWYDDGSFSLNVSVTDENSELVKQLKQSSPQTIRKTLSTYVGESSLEALLPLIASLSIFDERPQLFAPLLPLFRGRRSLSRPTKLRVASLAWKAGEQDWARPILLRAGYAHLKRSCKKHGYWAVEHEKDLSGALLEAAPSLLLRVVQRSRAKERITDKDPNKNRCQLIREIEAKLGRGTA